MPRVSIRRSLLYVAYTVVATTLVMLALHVQQQQSWQRVMEPAAGAQGDPSFVEDQQQNAKEMVETQDGEEFADATLSDVDQDEQPNSNSSSALRRRGLPWYIKDDGYRSFPNETIPDIWPGRYIGDRIESQLMIPDADPTDAAIKTIYLPNGLGSWQVKAGRRLFLDQKCPVDRCSLTGKRSDAEKADAIMFKGENHIIYHRKNLFL